MITVRESRMMRIGKASALLGISRSTLKDWIRRSLVPCSKSKGGHAYFSIRDIEEIKEGMRYGTEEIDS